jgi:hypothetical protein
LTLTLLPLPTLAFWLLEVLCDRLLPGYYSPSMHGTLLDQRVFESLVGRCLPMISDHFKSVDVQLSVASLPSVHLSCFGSMSAPSIDVGLLACPVRALRWFLSLYINSMPLIFAFRIVDCFMAMGPKVLFQIGLGASPQPNRPESPLQARLTGPRTAPAPSSDPQDQRRGAARGDGRRHVHQVRTGVPRGYRGGPLY